MSRKYILIATLLAVATLYLGCSTTNWGVARLPDARTLFVTQAQEESFVAKKDLVVPYQPVGFLEINTMKFQACGGNMTGMYTSLERAMANELVDKARQKLGAEAVINYKWSVKSSFQTYLQVVSQSSYCAPLLALGLPGMYILNVNTVSMKGTAVKK